MIFTNILIVAMSIPSLLGNLTPKLLFRISAIVFIYTGVLFFNAFFIQSIGSGMGIYSGLFNISNLSYCLNILIIAFLILNLIYSKSLNSNSIKEYSILILITILFLIFKLSI